MDIRQMKYFKTIVEQGTISKAAKVLHMAQPPLSMQLKQLEEELDVTLLKRGKRQVELTEAGQHFYKRCLQILDLTQTTKNELKQAYQDVCRIGITSSNSGLIHMPRIKDFICSHPHIQYHLHEGTTYEILDLLLSHNIDLGIVRTPFDTSLVDSYPLKSEPMIAIGHPKFFKEPKHRLKDFQSIPLIIHQRYLPLINDYSLSQQIPLLFQVTCDDSRTSLIWAGTSVGVAIVPQSSILYKYDSSLTYTILDDQSLYTGVTLITRKNENITNTLSEFMQLFIEGGYHEN